MNFVERAAWAYFDDKTIEDIKAQNFSTSDLFDLAITCFEWGVNARKNNNYEAAKTYYLRGRQIIYLTNRIDILVDAEERSSRSIVEFVDRGDLSNAAAYKFPQHLRQAVVEML